MVFPIVTLLFAILVAFLAFQTGGIDTGMPTESSASVSAPVMEDEAGDEEATEEE